MPRPPRVFISGECYHITTRGNNKGSIFFDDFDRREYLQRLYEVAAQYVLKIHAFALMTNHIHLLIQPSQGDTVSLALKLLNGSYTRYVNRRHERAGHLFQARFHSKHVDKDTYFLVASKYIHCNPVEAGMVQNPDQYSWSSARAFLSGFNSYLDLDRLIEKMIDQDLTLNFFPGSRAEQRNAYRNFLLVSDPCQVSVR